MKLIKLTVGMVAGLALAGGVAQAQIPATFAFSAGYENGSTAAINNSTLLSKVASYLNIKLPVGSKLAFNTNGALVIIDSAKNIVLDLTAGTNADDYFSTNVVPGIDGGFITNITFVNRRVGTSSGSENLAPEFLFFYDPIWAGSTTFDDTNLLTSSLFKVTGKAIAGGSDDDEYALYFEKIVFVQTSDQFGSSGFNEDDSAFREDYFEFADGAKATLSVSLKAGVYTLSFVINGSGRTFNQDFDGDMFGTLSASGTQTGGSSFLDPFNGFGNYDEDFSTF